MKMYNSFFCSLMVSGLVMGGQVHAQECDCPNGGIKEVKESLAEKIFDLPGVNGIGITSCGSELCIVVYTVNQAAADLVARDYQGEYCGQLLTTKVIGVIEPQPGITISN